MGWRFAGTSWAFRPTTHDKKNISCVLTGWAAAPPPATAGRPAPTGAKRGGSLQRLGHFFRSGHHTANQKHINRKRMSTKGIETNAGQGMAFRRNLGMFRPPALVSIRTRDIDWPRTSSSPPPLPLRPLSQVPPCCGLSSICRIPSAPPIPPHAYVRHADKHKTQTSHAHDLVGDNMKLPWREKGVSPDSHWAVRPATDDS
jgi:hypothetical protein